MRLFQFVYEGEGGEGTPAPKTFTQADVDRVVSERLNREKKAFQSEKEKLVGQLQELESAKGLSDEERTALSTRIEELQTSMMTKEELSAKEKKKLEQKAAADLEASKAEISKWQGLYTNSTIERAITDAAASAEAFRPGQIVALLKPATRLVEENGQLVTKVKFDGKDKDGKPVQLDLTVDQAIKQMKETPEEFGNLFKSGVTPGLGGAGSAGEGAGEPDLIKMAKDPAKWIEWRKKHPNATI